MAGREFIEFLSSTDRSILTQEENKKLDGYKNMPTAGRYVSGFSLRLKHVYHWQKLLG
jgi:hypothetical protein